MLDSVPISSSKPVERVVERADLLDAGAQRVGGDVVAEAVRGRVVGDREVLQPALARRLAPSPRRSAAVGRASCGSAGRRAGRSSSISSGSPPPPGARPRARRGPRAARAGSSRARASRRPPPRSRSAVVSPVASSRIPYSETCRPAPHGRLAQRHVVRLGAGEVLEHVAELVGLDDLQVDLHARVGDRPARRPRRTSATDSTSGSSASAPASAAGSEAVAMMSRSLTESAKRRSEPATSTRSAAGCARSALGDLARRRRARARARRAARRAVAVVGLGQHLREVLLGLGAEAAQLAQPAVLDRRAQRVERVDAELVVQPPRPLGPEARQVHDRDQADRELRAQLDRAPGCRRSRRARAASPRASCRCSAAR